MQIGSNLRQASGVAGILATIATAFAIIAFPYAVRSHWMASLSETYTVAVVPATPAPALMEPNGFVDPENGFTFGFLVYDWDPRAPGGVPGFDWRQPATTAVDPTIHAQIP